MDENTSISKFDILKNDYDMLLEKYNTLFEKHKILIDKYEENEQLISQKNQKQKEASKKYFHNKKRELYHCDICDVNIKICSLQPHLNSLKHKNKAEIKKFKDELHIL